MCTCEFFRLRFEAFDSDLATEIRVSLISTFLRIRFSVNYLVMANRRERDFVQGERIDDMDPLNDEVIDDSSSLESASSCGGVRSGASSSSPGEDGGSSSEVGLTERLTDILVEESDGDLLIQQTSREDRFLQWLQALDMQVMGACRADERLKPLLKMNTACGVSEDPLLTQLIQVCFILEALN